MLRQFLKAALHKEPQSDDRFSALIRPSDKPPVLRRRTMWIVAAALFCAIVYGSTAPFQLRPGAEPTWRLGWYLSWSSDLTTNVLIYIPIGAFVRLLVRRRGTSAFFEWIVSLLAITGLSYLTEVAQTVIVDRVPTWTDVVCNGFGAAIGIVLAPRVQTMIRNLHAVAYHRLREQPFSLAAGVALACVLACALLPFDIHPTPAHVGPTTAALTPAQIGWQAAPGEGADTAWHGQRVKKLIAAGSYGLLAVVLLLAAREGGRSVRASAWYALTRSMALVGVIEGLQLFTISHTASWRDLAAAWVACGLATLLAGLLNRGRMQMHERPAEALRGLVMTAGAATAVWIVTWACLHDVSPGPTSGAWLPMLHRFHVPWEMLLAEYATSSLQYLLTAVLVTLWYRSHRRAPRPRVVAGFALGAATVSMWIALVRVHAFDSSHLLLAAAAVAIALSLDRALFRLPGAPPISLNRVGR